VSRLAEPVRGFDHIARLDEGRLLALAAIVDDAGYASRRLGLHREAVPATTHVNTTIGEVVAHLGSRRDVAQGRVDLLRQLAILAPQPTEQRRGRVDHASALVHHVVQPVTQSRQVGQGCGHTSQFGHVSRARGEPVLQALRGSQQVAQGREFLVIEGPLVGCCEQRLWIGETAQADVILGALQQLHLEDARQGGAYFVILQRRELPNRAAPERRGHVLRNELEHALQLEGARRKELERCFPRAGLS